MGEDHHGDPTGSDEDADVTIRLASKKVFRPFAPHPDDFEWTDLAAGLCRIPRFNGQLPPEGAAGLADNYTDAQHLCLASDLLDLHEPNASRELRLAVHLHDGEEALAGLGDPVGPVKHARRFRAVLEPYFRAIQDTIAAKAGIPGELLRSPEVKRFDRMAYAIENWHLRGLWKGNAENNLEDIPAEHMTRLADFWCWPSSIARARWLRRLELLGLS